MWASLPGPFIYGLSTELVILNQLHGLQTLRHLLSGPLQKIYATSYSREYGNSKHRTEIEHPKKNHLRKSHPLCQAEIQTSVAKVWLGPSGWWENSLNAGGQCWQVGNCLLGFNQTHMEAPSH